MTDHSSRSRKRRHRQPQSGFHRSQRHAEESARSRHGACPRKTKAGPRDLSADSRASAARTRCHARRSSSTFIRTLRLVAGKRPIHRALRQSRPRSRRSRSMRRLRAIVKIQAERLRATDRNRRLSPHRRAASPARSLRRPLAGSRANQIAFDARRIELEQRSKGLAVAAAPRRLRSR